MSEPKLPAEALLALKLQAAVAAGLTREQGEDAARRPGAEHFHLDLTTLDLRHLYSGGTYREWLQQELPAMAPHLVACSVDSDSKSQPRRRMSARERLAEANREPSSL